MTTNDTKEQPLILAIETATRAGSVAVARGEQILSSQSGDATVSHSSNLIEIIERALAEAGASLSEIDLFAATVGPGSFTGLRIGLATVKGFAAVTKRKIAPVSTLAAIAHAAGDSERTVSVLPAGRGEVFAQMFSVNDGEVISLDQAMHLTPKQMIEKYAGLANLKFAGDANRLFEAPDSNTLKSETKPAEAGTAKRLAVSAAALALKSYREGNLVTPESLRADYVRPSDAEINERWQQQKAQAPA